MTAQPPLAERELPPETAARLRTSIMAEVHQPRRSRSGWRTALLAAAVALLLIGVTFALWTRSDTVLVAGPPVSPGDRLVLTDVGPLGDTLTQTELGRCRPAREPGVREVLYARLLTDGRSTDSAIVFRNTDDQIVLCSVNGLYAPTRGDERAHRPSGRFPVVPLTGLVSAGWMPDPTTSTPTTATGYVTSQAFAAGPGVASVQLRIVVDGRPGPWFVGAVHDGFTIVPLFEAGPVPLDRNGEPQVDVERRALDTDGRLVAVK